MATITKRNDTYKITVSCGYDTKGKQIRRNMTWKPLPGMTKKQIEKELQRQAVMFEEKCQSGLLLDASRIRLEDFCPQYLNNIKPEVSPTTYDTYEKIIKRCINPALGHMKLKDIKPLHVQNFINDLADENKRYPGQRKALKPASVRRYYVVLQSILQHAYRMEMIERNPADGKKIKLPTIGNQQTDIFTKQEIEVLLFYLDNEPLMFQLLIHLALATGCRRGELMALQWNDINFKNSTISVKKSSYKIKGEDIKTKETKTYKERTLTLPAYCMQILKDYRVEQSKERLRMGDKWDNGNWLFTQSDGKPMYPTTPTLWFTKFQEKNGMPHKKFHALRHTSATLLLSSGTNIKNVASRLGHQQLSTTNRYVHAVEEADKAAANALDDILSPKRA